MSSEEDPRQSNPMFICNEYELQNKRLALCKMHLIPPEPLWTVWLVNIAFV